MNEDELIEAARASLALALRELDRTSYAMQGGAAARVAAAAYALALLKGEAAEAPNITVTGATVHHRSLF